MSKRFVIQLSVFVLVLALAAISAFAQSPNTSFDGRGR
jgi:hypothetical protein